MSHPLFERHRALLDKAVAAIAERGYWSAFPESPSPKVYGEGAAEAGKAALRRAARQAFRADACRAQRAASAARCRRTACRLASPIRKVDLDALVRRGREGGAGRGARPGPKRGSACALEILTRINKRSFEIAHAVMHTTGQAFVMAFQAGCPHAQDRGLEAVAYAWDGCVACPPRRTGRSRRARTSR